MPASASLRRAADLLAEGDWHAAHLIVQDDDSALAAWMHGIVHMMEGDASNAHYWYGRASRPFPVSWDLRAEIEAAQAEARGAGPA